MGNRQKGRTWQSPGSPRGVGLMLPYNARTSITNEHRSRHADWPYEVVSIIGAGGMARSIARVTRS